MNAAQYGSDREVLQTAVDWLENGHQIALVTVAKTWGSSPRPCGSMLVMREDGVHHGSVSGGCVEDDLIARFKNAELSDSFPAVVDYGVSRQQALRVGLPCGGRLELVVESLHDQILLREIVQEIDLGQLLVRRLNLRTGAVELSHSIPSIDFQYNGETMSKVFGCSWHLLIIGAGELSQYVTRMALMLGYRVSVCDPREEYQSAWSFQGVDIIKSMPDDAVRSLSSKQRSVLVALTHDPKLDDMALMEALQAELFYVGALGSKQNSENRKLRLQQLGIDSNQINRLHAPIGLDLGSHTPAEIALAIMAEITLQRNRVNSETTRQRRSE